MGRLILCIGGDDNCAGIASGHGGSVTAKKFLNLNQIEDTFQGPVADSMSTLLMFGAVASSRGGRRRDLSIRIFRSRSSPVYDRTNFPTVAAAAGSACTCLFCER